MFRPPTALAVATRALVQGAPSAAGLETQLDAANAEMTLKQPEDWRCNGASSPAQARRAT
jgi:hypothetical protein